MFPIEQGVAPIAPGAALAAEERADGEPAPPPPPRAGIASTAARSAPAFSW